VIKQPEYLSQEDGTVWTMVPDNGLTRIELEILGRTDFYHVDYGSTEDWEITLPWTSRLPKSAIRED